MLAWVYCVVGLLVLLTFRSFKAVICIIMPLAMTSTRCQALMTYMGIGVKVATLPVIAQGVGIGVDYSIYIYSKLEYYMKNGETLINAYLHTLRSTGKAVDSERYIDDKGTSESHYFISSHKLDAESGTTGRLRIAYTGRWI